MGRTGKMWAIEHAGRRAGRADHRPRASPSGLPLGAFVARAELMETWGAGAHGSTFGGNPVAVRGRAGDAATSVEEGLLAHATEVGDFLLTPAGRAARPLPGLVTDVRGIGPDDRRRVPHRRAGRGGAAGARSSAGCSCWSAARRRSGCRRRWSSAGPGEDRAGPLRRGAGRARGVSGHVFAAVTPGRPAGRGRAAPAAEIVDAAGRRYLDGSGGAIVVGIGHGVTEVVDAIADAGPPDRVRPRHRVHDRSRSRSTRTSWRPSLPVDDARVYPVCGGSEAIETALKMARAYHLAQRRGPARGGLAAGLVPRQHPRRAGRVRPARPARAVPALARAGRHTSTPYDTAARSRDTHPVGCGARHAAELERIILAAGAGRVAAFVAEPIAGAALGRLRAARRLLARGRRGLPPARRAADRRRGDDRLRPHRHVVRAASTGTCGPTSSSAAKGASSGYWPLGLRGQHGAVHDTIAAGGFVHGFTWSHHPSAPPPGWPCSGYCANAALIKAAERQGARLDAALHAELAGHPAVGDIRGIGMLRAVEFVVDREARHAVSPRPSASPNRSSPPVRTKGRWSTPRPAGRTARTATWSCSGRRWSSRTLRSTISCCAAERRSEASSRDRTNRASVQSSPVYASRVVPGFSMRCAVAYKGCRRTSGIDTVSRRPTSEGEIMTRSGGTPAHWPADEVPGAGLLAGAGRARRPAGRQADRRAEERRDVVAARQRRVDQGARRSGSPSSPRTRSPPSIVYERPSGLTRGRPRQGGRRRRRSSASFEDVRRQGRSARSRRRTARRCRSSSRSTWARTAGTAPGAVADQIARSPPGAHRRADRARHRPGRDRRRLGRRRSRASTARCCSRRSPSSSSSC